MNSSRSSTSSPTSPNAVLARRHSTSADAVKTESAPAVDVTRLSQVDLVEAMSTLSTKSFLDRLQDHPGSMEERRRARHCLVHFWSALDSTPGTFSSRV